MPYQFATDDLDFTDYASGRVIYSLPGAPAFPVRLASEIFQRAQRHLQKKRLTLYDPTCGGAYHLAALGFLHGPAIQTILASDADETVIPLAQRNLGLLSHDGLDRRAQELTALHEQYGKESHAGALQSLARLRSRLEGYDPPRTRAFQANVFDQGAIQVNLSGESVDLIISDVPYGQLTGWHMRESQPSTSPLWLMLESLRGFLPPGALVAIAADKNQKIAHEGYRRLERFQVGKRQAAILQPLGGGRW